jgi:hypothetical protein
MRLENLGQTAASALIHMDIRLEQEHWTMFRNKTLGIAAAATFGLAAMLGSTAAYAVKICDSSIAARAELTADGGDCFDSVTFAEELLLRGNTNVQAASDESDTTAYYNITDDLFLGAPTDVGATTGDAYIVAITLDGMVFRSTGANLSYAGTGGGTFTAISGGEAGGNNVLFRLTGGTVSSTDGALSLDADFAVSADGGSATLTMTNQSIQGLNLPGVDGTETHEGNPIMIASALNEVSTETDPTADVAADGFMQFVDAAGRNVNSATVGSLMVGVTTGNDARRALDGTPVTDLATIVDTGSDDAFPPVPNSSVRFMGDFSFASSVTLHGNHDCSDAGVGLQLLKMEGGEVSDTTMTVAVDVAIFATPKFLCITVNPTADDAMRIPATSAYTAMGSYTGVTDAAIGPRPEEQTLGMIERNGTTVRLPYLSTHAKFHQRIRIVNRGPDADYEMEFHGADDVPGADASGTLAANTITVLSLTDDDVVTPANGNNTSGTIIAEAKPGLIDVATVLVTRATGASDTVVHTAE